MRWDGARSRPILDPASGNINLHGRSGLVIAYKEQAAGVFSDLSARTLFFEIDGVDRIAMTPMGGDVTVQLIDIPAAVTADLTLDSAVAACVRDETGEPFVTWAGQIRTFGFTAVPPVLV